VDRPYSRFLHSNLRINRLRDIGKTHYARSECTIPSHTGVSAFDIEIRALFFCGEDL
jgi:hypothetical protein